MNDEAAESRGPSGQSQDVPASSEPTADFSADPTHSAASSDPVDPPTEDLPPAWTPPPGGVPEADAPPPPGDIPPGSGAPPAGDMPPWAGGAPFSRDKLVRPRHGRYIAGVCTALARATNTDPVLWRVLLAVLGVMSGVGVLLYLVGWLTIPAEGDTASPVESLLGKGRSGMAPPAVLLLGAAAVISFGFIVNDGMRASLLAAAVVLGAVLLIKRSGWNRPPETATFAAASSAPTGTPMAAPTAAQPGASAPSGFPPAAPAPAAPTFPPPTSGYRPPFAPHGPWASSAPEPPLAPRPPHQPRPPRPPRERSMLGRLTLFAVLMVIGVLVLISMAGAAIPISGYFAAALVTIALGLILGAWVGRARGLIALAMLTTAGLVAATGAEHWGGELGASTYRPLSIAAVADRYDFSLGRATLDLRDVDFTGQQQSTTINMKFGELRVLLPPAVDTTATLRMQNGKATILDKQFDGREVNSQSITDLGTDGAGGGTLTLNLQMDTGIVEVVR